MNLPKWSSANRPKIKLIVCQEPGCGMEFYGHYLRKYCDAHASPTARKILRPKYEDPSVKNFVFQHKFQEPIRTIMVCDLPGCNNSFEIKVMPRQYVYPKYCHDHRNEYKRNLFVKQQKAAA